jgi:hypothetical protein
MDAPRAITSTPAAESVSAPQTVAQMVEGREEDMPQTQMAAAFAALNLDKLTSDPLPEETEA